LDADAFILLDNISFPIRSDALCVCATDSTKMIRVLGSSRSLKTPISSLFILTGNNLALLGDLARRILMIRLDAGCERPELRTFKRDAMQTIRDRRDELIVAALTVSIAYFRAGCPPARPDPDGRETVSPYGSFDDWDRMIRRPLIWAGMPDPLDAVGDLRQDDHEFIAMRDLLRAWHATYGEKPVTAGCVVQNAAEFIGGGPSPAERKAPALFDAMSAMGIEPRTSASRELGYKLRAWQGRIVGGLRLDRDRKTMTGIAYAVRQIGNS
jgi:putative DNA primase/helicase